MRIAGVGIFWREWSRAGIKADQQKVQEMSDTEVMFLIPPILVALFGISGLIGSYVARKNGRSFTEVFWFGLFGPLAVLLFMMLL